jgi:hypothetical protein
MSSTTHLMLSSARLQTPPAAAPQVAANASGRLLGAEQKAQAAGRGVWRE